MIWRPTTLVIAAGAIFWKVEAWRSEVVLRKREKESVRGRAFVLFAREFFS